MSIFDDKKKYYDYLKLFVTFEGLDGSGKTTQVDLFERLLKSKGIDYIRTREPGGNPVAEKVRHLLLDVSNTGMDPIAEALGYAMARAEHVHRTIMPALAKNKFVLCDRFVDSSIAFQGNGRELGMERIMDINKHAVDGCMPDLTFYIKLPTELSLKRLHRPGQVVDRIEQEAFEFHDRVAKGFDKIALDNPERVVVINGDQTLNKVHFDILNSFRTFCLKKGYDLGNILNPNCTISDSLAEYPKEEREEFINYLNQAYQIEQEWKRREYNVDAYLFGGLVGMAKYLRKYGQTRLEDFVFKAEEEEYEEYLQKTLYKK